MKIAAFGLRSVPPREGCAGADKFASELFPRLVRNGHDVLVYNRLYPGQNRLGDTYQGVRIKYFRTVHTKGLDTLVHSCKSTLRAIFKDRPDIVHIQNGGNSIWAILLRLAGIKVVISQDGIDWNRDKWPWYGRLYLRLSALITAHIPNAVIFDNVFAKEHFENRFGKKFDFVPFGSDVSEFANDDAIFKRLGIKAKDYFLFVGRFIPDKGLHYLLPAFKMVSTEKKLVLVGGSPNPSDYEKKILSTDDKRIIFPGYVYGEDSLRLMKNAYCYIQPSDVEGLSPVILNVMGLGTPIICSDIKENIYAVSEDAILFRKGDIISLKEGIERALDTPEEIFQSAERARTRVLATFSWDKVTSEHEAIFNNLLESGIVTEGHDTNIEELP